MAWGTQEALPKGIHLDEPDGPRNSRRRAPQFLVHEIGEPAEEQAEGHAAGDVIVDPQPRQFLLARQIEDSERGADHSAVERHSAVPQLQYLDRVLKILAEIVRQHVADAAAENDPERGIEYEVVGMPAAHRRAGFLG